MVLGGLKILTWTVFILFSRDFYVINTQSRQKVKLEGIRDRRKNRNNVKTHTKSELNVYGIGCSTVNNLRTVKKVLKKNVFFKHD